MADEQTPKTGSDNALNQPTPVGGSVKETLNSNGIATDPGKSEFSDFVNNVNAQGNDLFSMQEDDVARVILTPPKLKIPDFAANLYQKRQFNYQRLMSTARDKGYGQELKASNPELNPDLTPSITQLDRKPSTYLLNESQTTATLGIYQFHRTVSMNYMRKMLALQYHQNVTLNNIASTSEQMGKMLESKLDAIKLNTAAPESKKTTFIGRVREELRMQFARSIAQTIRTGTSGYAMKKFNQYVAPKITSATSDFFNNRQDLGDIASSIKNYTTNILASGAKASKDKASQLEGGVVKRTSSLVGSGLDYARNKIDNLHMSDRTRERLAHASNTIRTIMPTASINEIINSFLDTASNTSAVDLATGSGDANVGNTVDIPVAQHSLKDLSPIPQETDRITRDFQSKTLDYLAQIVDLLKGGNGGVRHPITPIVPDGGPMVPPTNPTPAGPSSTLKEKVKNAQDKVLDKTKSMFTSHVEPIVKSHIDPHAWNDLATKAIMNTPTSIAELKDLSENAHDIAKKSIIGAYTAVGGHAADQIKQHVTAGAWNDLAMRAAMAVPTSADELTQLRANIQDKLVSGSVKAKQSIRHHTSASTWNDLATRVVLATPTSVDEAKEAAARVGSNLSDRADQVVQRHVSRETWNNKVVPTALKIADRVDNAKTILTNPVQVFRGTLRHLREDDQIPSQPSVPDSIGQYRPMVSQPQLNAQMAVDAFKERWQAKMHPQEAPHVYSPTPQTSGSGVEDKILHTLSDISYATRHPFEFTQHDRLNSYADLMHHKPTEATNVTAHADTNKPQDKGPSLLDRLKSLLGKDDDDSDSGGWMDKLQDLFGGGDHHDTHEHSRKKKRIKRPRLGRWVNPHHDGNIISRVTHSRGASIGKQVLGSTVRGGARLGGALLDTAGAVGGGAIKGAGLATDLGLAAGGGLLAKGAGATTRLLFGKGRLGRSLGWMAEKGVGGATGVTRLASKGVFGGASLAARGLGKTAGFSVRHLPTALKAGWAGTKLLTRGLAAGAIGMGGNWLTDKLTTQGSVANHLGHGLSTGAEWAAMGAALGPWGAAIGGTLGMLEGYTGILSKGATVFSATAGNFWHQMFGQDAKMSPNGQVINQKKDQGFLAQLSHGLMNALKYGAAKETIGDNKIDPDIAKSKAAQFTPDGLAAANKAGAQADSGGSDYSTAVANQGPQIVHAAMQGGNITDQPEYKGLMKKLPKEITDRISKSQALQFTAWSTSTQMGVEKATKIFKDNYTDKETDIEYLRKIFQERSQQFANTDATTRELGISQVGQEQDYASSLEDGSAKFDMGKAASIAGAQISPTGSAMETYTPHPKPTSAETDKRAQQGVAYLMQKGWSKEQATGIIANLIQESGLDPQVRPGDGGAAIGLAQWHSDRSGPIEKKFGKSISQMSFTEQLDAVNWELHGSERGAGQMLAKAKTPEEAARVISLHYERPGLGEQAHAQEAANRAAIATNLTTKLGKMGPDASKGDGTQGTSSAASADSGGATQASKSVAAGGSSDAPQTSTPTAPTSDNGSPAQATAQAQTSAASSAVASSPAVAASTVAPTPSVTESVASAAPVENTSPRITQPSTDSQTAMLDVLSKFTQQTQTLTEAITKLGAQQAQPAAGHQVVANTTHNTNIHIDPKNDLDTRTAGTRSGVV